MNNLVVQLLLKTGSFSTDLKQAGGEIKQFKKGCSDAGDVVSAFSKSLGINIGAIKKFAPAAAAAAAAGKILKDSFKQNTDAMDAFNRETEVVKSTYRSLTSQLFKNGSMSFDFKGIAEQAREYYDAMDKANVANVAITNELKLQQTEYDRLYAVAQDVSLGEVDRLEALNEASAVMERQITLKKQLAQLEKNSAKESLENELVSRGVDRYWLETTGQKALEKLLKYDEENLQYVFDTMYEGVNIATAGKTRKGATGGVYDRAVEQVKTDAGLKALKKEAKGKGYGEDVDKYLQDLKKEQDKADSLINMNEYQLAQALHNMRTDTEGYEKISKYFMLYINDYGIGEVNAQAQATRSMIERLKKRIKGGRSGGSKTEDKEEFPEGSLAKLDQDVKDKYQEWWLSTNEEARAVLWKEYESLKDSFDILSGNKKVLTKGSEDWLKAESDRLGAEITSLDVGLPDTKEIIGKMNEWEDSWEEFVESLTDEEKELFNKFAKTMNKRWELMNQKSVYDTAISVSQGNKTKKYTPGSYNYKKQELNKKIEDTREGLANGANLTEEEIKKKLDEIKKLEAEAEALDIQYGFKVSAETTDSWENFGSVLSNVSSIASNLSTIMSNVLDDETMKKWNEFFKWVNVGVAAFQMLNSLIQLTTGLQKIFASESQKSAAETATAATTEATAVVAAKEAEAAAATGSAGAKGADAVAGIPIVGPALAVAAVATIVAAIMAAMSKAKSLKFAQGGIVPGTSFTGDRVTAQVNSGEMVLTKAQQANLYNMANSGVGGGGHVEFHISGTELVGVLNNQNRKNKLIR